MSKLVLTRDVSIGECPWLDKDMKKGDMVYEYKEYTYGCITNNGVACSKEEEETPFFELPIDSVKVII
ncbi:hypothetical protein LCGC14_0245990 [marine sediment metagenome]|uniref:Uncharacterized protein n=1 Tax=marine sediment metagenome TaxID=412755 RepID=A0A0F9XAM1_9ZZZZ